MIRCLLACAILLVGCSKPATPIDEVVVCDRSTSATCDERTVTELAQSFMAANPPHGSRFEVLATGCGVADIGRAYRIVVPSRWGSGVAKKRKAFYEAERARLDALALPPLRRCSGIAAAIWKGSRVLSEGPPADRRLVIVSDMREASTDLGVNFERKLPLPEEFVERLRAHELLPNLSGFQAVVVCGVHDGGTPETPKWSAAMSNRLAAIWRAAFSAMKAPTVELRQSCQD